MKSLIDLYNAIKSGETASSLIKDKDESTTGHIGEAILRLAVALQIDPAGSNTKVIGLVLNTKNNTFNSIVDSKSYMSSSNINNGCKTGKIDAAWMIGGSYVVCSSKFGIKSIASIDQLEIADIQTTMAVMNITHEDSVVDKSSVAYAALVSDKDRFVENILKKSRSHAVRKILKPSNVFGLDDLDRICFRIRDLDVLSGNTPSLDAQLRFHQALICRNAMRTSGSRILIGAIPRSGKTYIGARLCVGYSKILILTTRPSETMNSWADIFRTAREFTDYTITCSTDESISVVDGNQVAIASTQFFKYGDRRTTRGFQWDIILIDEIHEGGCTDKSKEILDNNSGTHTKFVLMTATYNKPILEFAIPSESCFFWDLEDVRLMKNWSSESSSRLAEKYGTAVLEIEDEFTRHKKTISTPYHDFPSPYMLTTSMHQKYYSKILRLMENPSNIYGFSMRSLFMTTKDDSAFQNPKAVDMFLRLISGSNCEEDYPDGDMSIISRIERIQQQNNHRKKDVFHVWQWFIPYGTGHKLDGVKRALAERIRLNDVLSDFNVMTFDSGMSEIPKTVKSEVVNARSQKKAGLIILTGDVGSLGVSIPEVDATFLLHDFESSDKTFQQLSRCLTEDPKNEKKVGIIVDFNVWRVMNTIATYANGRCGKVFDSTYEKLSWCISNLIKIDADLWECESELSTSMSTVVEELCVQWTRMLESAGHSLSTLERQVANIGDDQAVLNGLIRYSKTTKLTSKSDEEMPDGVSVRSESETGSEKEPSDEKEELKNININELLARVIPEMALLSGCDKTMIDAIVHIGRLPTLRNAMSNFIGQFSSLKMEEIDAHDMWNTIMEKIVLKNVKSGVLSFASEVFDSIRTQMLGILDDPEKLIEFLGIHLKPKELEKKKNGEVFTSPLLINEKFDKLDETTWTDPTKKFLDPANGIGNYPAVAFHRLMRGLDKSIPNPLERKKHILENMLYMCELTPKNVEVSRRLFDPEGIYNLNLFQGSFFDLDTQKTWNVEKFDVIMGNPPYQEDEASGDNKLYLTFTMRSIELLKNNGLLMFVTPRNIISYLLMTGKNRYKIDTLYNIKHLAIETCGQYFKNVGSSFLWFILEKAEYTGPTRIEYMNGKTIASDTIMLSPGMKLPKTITPLDISIVSKVTSTDDVFKFKDFTFNGSSRRIRSEHIKKGVVMTTKTTTHQFPISDTINKTNPFPGKLYYYTTPDDAITKHKIVLSKKGYLQATIDKTNQYSYSDNFKYIDKGDLDGLYLLFTSELITYMLKQFSTNGFDKISIISTMRYVDIKPQSTIEDIYLTYGLTSDEISRIKSFV